MKLVLESSIIAKVPLRIFLFFFSFFFFYDKCFKRIFKIFFPSVVFNFKIKKKNLFSDHQVPVRNGGKKALGIGVNYCNQKYYIYFKMFYSWLRD